MSQRTPTIAEIRERWAKTSAGPWHWSGNTKTNQIYLARWVKGMGPRGTRTDMHLFTAHRDQTKRYFANFELPTHPVCWLRGHRAFAEVQDPGYNIDSWILVACRTCGIRHQDPYMSRDIRPKTPDEAKAIIARQVQAARTNPTGYAGVRDGRDGYGHHRLELSLEVTRRGYRKTGVHLRIGDRWSETPFDGSIHIGRNWAAYFSIGGVGNRLAHWLTKGKKRELSIGARYRGESS